eukprot:1150689-Pelagomonas_calceolata.AAC.3
MGPINLQRLLHSRIASSSHLFVCLSPVVLQNFAHCASHSSLRGRPLLVERLLVLARALWPVRPTLVLKHALPAAFSLLNDTKGDGRTAANTLLMVGYCWPINELDSCLTSRMFTAFMEG